MTNSPTIHKGQKSYEIVLLCAARAQTLTQLVPYISISWDLDNIFAELGTSTIIYSE